MPDDPNDVFGPVVLAPEPPAEFQPTDAGRIPEIQARLRVETKAHQTAVAKRQFKR